VVLHQQDFYHTLDGEVCLGWNTYDKFTLTRGNSADDQIFSRASGVTEKAPTAFRVGSHAESGIPGITLPVPGFLSLKLPGGLKHA